MGPTNKISNTIIYIYLYIYIYIYICISNCRHTSTHVYIYNNLFAKLSPQQDNMGYVLVVGERDSMQSNQEIVDMNGV
jgi:hypothetical protein